MSTYTQPIQIIMGSTLKGLTGSVGYTIFDNTGTQKISRTTTGITELSDGAGTINNTGIYVAYPTFDTAWLPAVVRWDVTGQPAIVTVSTIGVETIAGSSGGYTPPTYLWVVSYPSKPTNFTAVTSGTATIALSWSANPESNIDHYIIKRNLITITVPSTQTSFTDNNRISGHTYNYSLYAVNTSNYQSPVTNTITVIAL